MTSSFFGLDEKKLYDLSIVSEKNYILIKKEVNRIISSFCKLDMNSKLEILEKYREKLTDEQWIIFYNSITIPNDILCKQLINEGKMSEVQKRYNVGIIQTNYKKMEYKIFNIDKLIQEEKITKECFSNDFYVDYDQIQDNFTPIIETIRSWNLPSHK